MKLILRLLFFPLIVLTLLTFGIIDLNVLKNIYSRPNVLLISYICVSGVLILTVIRWKITCQTDAFNPNFLELLRLVCISNVAALTLPGGLIAGDIVRGSLVYFTNIEKRMLLFSAIIFDRLVSLLALFILTSLLLAIQAKVVMENLMMALFSLNIFLITLVLFLSIFFILKKRNLRFKILVYSMVGKMREKILPKFGLRAHSHFDSLTNLISRSKNTLRSLTQKKHLLAKNCILSGIGFLLHALALLFLFNSGPLDVLSSLNVFTSALASWCVSIVILTPGGIVGGEISFYYFLTSLGVDAAKVGQAINIFFAHRLLFLFATIVLWGGSLLSRHKTAQM